MVFKSPLHHVMWERIRACEGTQWEINKDDYSTFYCTVLEYALRKYLETSDALHFADYNTWKHFFSDNPSSKASLKPELGWCKYERQEAGQIHQNIDLFPIQMNATSFLTMDVDGLLDHFCKPRKSDSSTTWSTKEGYTHWCITPWTRHEKERVAAGIKKPAEGTKIGEFLDNAERGIIDMEVIESSDSIKAFLNSYLRWNGQTEIFGGSDMAGNEHGLEVGNSEDDVGEGGPALRGDIRKSSSVLSDDSSVGGGAPLG